jgi:Protein of unknown function (DUF3800)
VLHAYVDDSGIHDNSRLCLVAGYFGSEQQWMRFDEKWSNALTDFEVEEFHANRYWSHVNGADVSEYRGWDTERDNRFINQLLHVIESANRIFPVCCSVVMAEWNALPSDERSYLTGGTYHADSGKIVRPGAPLKPYFLAFLTAISLAIDYCKPGHRMHFSFDPNKRFSGYAREYFREIRNWGSDHGMLEKYNKLGDIFFPDSKLTPAIQAADLLAYESYQRGLELIERGRQGLRSEILARAITNIRNLNADSKIFDKYGFDLMLATYRSIKAEAQSKV